MQVHWGQVCMTSYPYCPMWTTDRHTGQKQEGIHTHKHTMKPTHIHTGTLTHIPECYQYTGILVALKAGARPWEIHSTCNKQSKTNKRIGWRGWGWERVRLKKADWLGICLKEEVRAAWCLSNRRAIWRGKKRREVKKRKAGRTIEQL